MMGTVPYHTTLNEQVLLADHALDRVNTLGNKIGADGQAALLAKLKRCTLGEAVTMLDPWEAALLSYGLGVATHLLLARDMHIFGDDEITADNLEVPVEEANPLELED